MCLQRERSVECGDHAVTCDEIRLALGSGLELGFALGLGLGLGLGLWLRLGPPGAR